MRAHGAYWEYRRASFVIYAAAAFCLLAAFLILLFH